MDKVNLDFNLPENRMIIQYLLNQYYTGDDTDLYALMSWFTDLAKSYRFQETNHK